MQRKTKCKGLVVTGKDIHGNDQIIQFTDHNHIIVPRNRVKEKMVQLFWQKTNTSDDMKS